MKIQIFLRIYCAAQLWSLNYTSDVYTIIVLYPACIFFLLYLFRLFARMVAVMMLMLKNNRLAVRS